MFRSADAVVTASEHEGFCLPLLEAMTFEKPIVARACAAIPETVGDAALLLPPEQGPAFFAEAVTELLANEPLQRRAGRGRAGAGWPSSSAARRTPRSSKPCSRSSDAPALRRAALRRDDRGRRRAALPRDGRADGATRSSRRGRDHLRAVVRRLGRRVRAGPVRRSAASSCTGSASRRRATTRGSTS